MGLIKVLGIEMTAYLCGMLQAKGIKKSYRQLEVLKGINLNIKKGEIVSIVGASGAGKSTLLQILGTLDNPDEGLITLNDKVISNLKPNKLADFRNNHIGFIFQFHNLLPEFTALENVCLPGYIGKLNTTKVEKRATEPNIFLSMTDNWIVLILRFVTETRKRRVIHNKLSELILEEISKSKDIKIASQTIDIVGFPKK